MNYSFNIAYIDQQAEFDQAMTGIQQSSWIGFDTEFVGERTFVPILCLLQVVSTTDIYLIDTLKVKDLTLFLNIIENPATLKITHAGDNDYRLLNTLYGVVPKNVFDTQIAAGFVGYNYPAGFSKIVDKELRISLAKSHTVADWEKRPLDKKALDYAIEDVKYLPALHEKLTAKLERKKRTSWSKEESLKWENSDFYEVDPYKEALNSDYIHQLSQQEQIFLMRIYAWRRDKAMQLNVPKEQVLQSRHVSSIVRVIKDGHGALRANRTLPENAWRKYQGEWQILWKQAPAQEELAILETLPPPPANDPEQDWQMEFLYHLVKKQCMDCDISPALLLPRGDFNRLKNGSDDFDYSLLDGWRAELLGETLTHWLKKSGSLQLTWQSDDRLLVEK